MTQKVLLFTLYKLCALPVRMCIPGEDESQWNEHPHREWGYSHREWGCPSPGMGMCFTGNAHTHREWEYASPGMHILTRNGDVPHEECTSSPRMGIASPGMYVFTGNVRLHRECASSPGMHILTRDAQSLYRVLFDKLLNSGLLFCRLNIFGF